MQQRPSLLLFVGRKTKDVALRELFSWNNLKRSQRNGVATLTAETLSIQSDFPILFAESDPVIESIPQVTTSALCHETSPYPANWALSGSQNIYDIVHARLFCLFIDVLCIFADDFRDFEEVVSRLQAWAALGRATKQVDSARPKVIIVKQGTGPGPSSTYDLLQSESLHHDLSQLECREFFSSITVIYLADEQISTLARHRRLKELIQRQTEEIRHLKQSVGCSYSALHLSCFFTDAVKHTARTITEPFDFLLSSRRTNPVSVNFPVHLSEFLRLSTQRGLSHRMRTTFIASTILLDAYPPGMHCELFPSLARVSYLTARDFDPEHIYDSLYKPLCHQSLVAVYQKASVVHYHSQAIRDRLADLFAIMQVTAQPATAIHLRNLKDMSNLWMQVRTNQTCLPCLQQKPEHPFTCGHSLCDVCVRSFGRPVLEAEYSYMLDCILCSFGTLQAALKPPTAGTRILSIDGGGVRGVIPLEFLGILQETIGPDCPIQDLFDLAFGTSSGT